MNVLLADRSKQIRNRIENLVKGICDDVTVFHTDSNFDAMQHVKNNIFDVILFDLDLLDGSGFKLLSITRSIPYKPIKIIFTNHVQNNLRDVSYKLGVNYFLNKSQDFLKIKKIINCINEKERMSRKS